jgi:hypothetical protein
MENIKQMKLYYPGSIDDKNKWSCILLGAWTITNK